MNTGRFAVVFAVATLLSLSAALDSACGKDRTCCFCAAEFKTLLGKETPAQQCDGPNANTNYCAMGEFCPAESCKNDGTETCCDLTQDLGLKDKKFACCTAAQVCQKCMGPDCDPGTEVKGGGATIPYTHFCGLPIPTTNPTVKTTAPTTTAFKIANRKVSLPDTFRSCESLTIADCCKHQGRDKDGVLGDCMPSYSVDLDGKGTERMFRTAPFNKQCRAKGDVTADGELSIGGTCQCFGQYCCDETNGCHTDTTAAKCHTRTASITFIKDQIALLPPVLVTRNDKLFDSYKGREGNFVCCEETAGSNVFEICPSFNCIAAAGKSNCLNTASPTGAPTTFSFDASPWEIVKNKQATLATAATPAAIATWYLDHKGGKLNYLSASTAAVAADATKTLPDFLAAAELGNFVGCVPNTVSAACDWQKWDGDVLWHQTQRAKGIVVANEVRRTLGPTLETMVQVKDFFTTGSALFGSFVLPADSSVYDPAVKSVGDIGFVGLDGQNLLELTRDDWMRRNSALGDVLYLYFHSQKSEYVPTSGPTAFKITESPTPAPYIPDNKESSTAKAVKFLMFSSWGR